MKRLAPLLLAASLLSIVAAPAGHASIDADRVTGQPGATLLIPYFEVGLRRGPDTTFTFGVTGTQDPDFSGANRGPSATVTNVTLWSELGYPVFRFNVYFTGYDTVDVDLRQVLNGQLPRTASSGQDATDTISHQGPVSQDLNYATCGPFLPPGAVPADQVAHMQAALTGRASPTNGNCYCLSHGDRIARGYITIDAVNQCSLEFPITTNYFTNVLTPVDNLWGDYQITPLGLSSTMVSIRAHPTDPQTTTSGNYTFYGHLIPSQWDAVDHRQPLATKFAAPFRNIGGRKPTKTTLIVWRDPKTTAFQSTSAGFDCAQPPVSFPLAQDEIVVFDEQETAYSFADAPFGRATQRVQVGRDMPVVPRSGWIYLDLNHQQRNGPPADPAAAQAWVLELQRQGKGPPLSYPVSVLDSAQTATHIRAAS